MTLAGVTERAVVLDRLHTGDARQLLGEIGPETLPVVLRVQQTVDVVEDVLAAKIQKHVGLSVRGRFVVKPEGDALASVHGV